MSDETTNCVIPREISQTLYVLKALAIICVAAAHCGSFTYPVAETIRGLIATLGVPVFFISSGFFFRTGESAFIFWTKKLKSIVIPWLFWGMMTYVLISILGSTAMTIEGCVRWVFGYKTWLYFVPVLLANFALFRVVKKNWWIYFIIIISLISWLFTHTGIIKVTEYLTLYQNPFNYSFLFALGMLLRKRDLTKFAIIQPGLKFLVLIVFLCIGVVYGITGNIGYWGSVLSIPFELLGVYLLFLVSFSIRELSLLIWVGKITYFIYFTHMIIGSGIANTIVWNHIPTELGVIECLIAFIKPLLTVLVCLAMCIVIRFVTKVAKIERLQWIIGL